MGEMWKKIFGGEMFQQFWLGIYGYTRTWISCSEKYDSKIGAKLKFFKRQITLIYSLCGMD